MSPIYTASDASCDHSGYAGQLGHACHTGFTCQVCKLGCLKRSFRFAIHSIHVVNSRN